MANMKEVNKAIQAAHPGLKIELVRADGYAYFSHADDTYEQLPSVMSHPPVTKTEDMIRMALDTISSELKEQEAYEQEKYKSGACHVASNVSADHSLRGILGNGGELNPRAVEPAPLKEGDRIVTTVGQHRVVYVLAADAQLGVPTPARMEAWASDVGLSFDLCIVDECGNDHEGMERALEKVVEEYEKVGGCVPKILLIGPGHRGSSKSTALAEYQRGMFDHALREVSSLHNTPALTRGQKRWNRKTMGYRNGY